MTGSAIDGPSCVQAPVSLKLVLMQSINMRSSRFFSYFGHVIFWSALLYGLYEAAPPRKEPWLPWDKAEHFVMFYVLATAAMMAFPRRNLIGIAIILSGIGGLIEIAQGTALVNRDSELGDWIACIVGVSAAIGPVFVYQWRVWHKNS